MTSCSVINYKYDADEELNDSFLGYLENLQDVDRPSPGLNPTEPEYFKSERQANYLSVNTDGNTTISPYEAAMHAVRHISDCEILRLDSDQDYFAEKAPVIIECAFDTPAKQPELLSELAEVGITGVQEATIDDIRAAISRRVDGMTHEDRLECGLFS